MRRAQRIVVPALLSGLVATSAAAQNALDVRSVKPVMMVLVDTSGSMERLPDQVIANGPSCVDCLPTCNNDPLQDATQKNRWAITLEALTGTFNNFKCQLVDRSTAPFIGAYDYGYHLPHFDFTTASTQTTDGVLDAFEYRTKFGLMTFDGVGTTIGGEPLVPTTTWTGDPAFRAKANGSEGMYSYGNVGRLSFPGCATDYGINAGARGPDADVGKLVSVGLSDDGPTVAHINSTIQQELLKVRPFGGTPTAAMLDDLRYYFLNNTDVKEGSGGDPYFACRKRYAVLLTDGAPDALFRDTRFQCDSTNDATCAGNKCECPYQQSTDIVRDMIARNLLDELYVVAFNVNDQAAIAALDDIAYAGGTDKAMTSTSPTALKQALNAVMQSSGQTDATSRSVPVAASSGVSVLLGGTQYRITAGFQVAERADEPWTGLLYRQRIGCDGASVLESSLTASEGDLFHETLNSMSDTQRILFSVEPQVGNQAGSIFVDDSDNVFRRDDLPYNGAGFIENVVHSTSGTFTGTPSPDDSVVAAQANEDVVAEPSTLATKTALFNLQFPAGYFTDANGNGINGEAADRDIIVKYVRGITRPGKKLADIYHSNPTVLEPLSLTSDNLASSSGYASMFHRTVASVYGADGRPGIVFVGTNDGILHAFNLEEWRDRGGAVRGAGEELWGFIPPALFTKMATTAVPTHQSMFDGTPIVSDVVLRHEVAQTGTTPDFGTVLVAAVRGAPAFVALDVTYPDQPRFLWQFSDPAMGDTVGNPVLTQALVDWNGAVQERAIAILPGGKGTEITNANGTSKACPLNDTNAVPGGATPLFDNPDVSPDVRTGAHYVRCWKQKGRALYVVDVATGELIQRFDYRHFPSPLTGSVAAGAAALEVAHAAYFSDQDGLLWRLSMMNTDPSKWRVQPLIDMFEEGDQNTGRPATYAPVVTKDRYGRNVILVGTGDVDNLIDSVAHHVFSLTELSDTDGSGELAGGLQFNWFITLDPGEQVTGPLTRFRTGVYFGSFQSDSGSGDACAFGSSRFWGVHYNQEDPANPHLPLPMLPDPNGGPTLVTNTLIEDADGRTDNSLLLGVALSRQPVCAVGTTLNNDPNLVSAGFASQRFQTTGATGGGAFQITGMVGGSGGTAPAGSALSQFTQTLSSTTQVSVSSFTSSVE